MVMNATKLKFPIKFTQVIRNKEFPKEINKNDPAKCIFCGCNFKLNDQSMFIASDLQDELPYVCCPKCRRYTSIVYYADPPMNKRLDNRLRNLRRRKKT